MPRTDDLERILTARHRAFLLGVLGRKPSHRYRAEFRRLNRQYVLLKTGKRLKTRSKRSKPPFLRKKIVPSGIPRQNELFSAVEAGN